MSSKKFDNREHFLNKRIVELRNAIGIKQIDLAKKLLISKGYLSEVENGKKKLSIKLLVRLFENFGVNLHWLLTGEGDMEEKKPEKELKLDSVTDKILEKVSAMTEMQKKLILNFVEEKEFVWKSIEKEKEEKAAFKKKLKVN